MKRCACWMWWLFVFLGSSIYGQEQLVTYQFSNTALSSVLDEFHKQTAVDFAYDNFATSKVYVSGKGQNQMLTAALDQLLTATHFEQTWVGNTCVIAKRLISTPAPTLNYQDVLISIQVDGLVMDAESNETLPFASIYNLRSKQNLMTNEFGRFHATFLMSHPEDTLLVSYVGFESKKIKLEQLIRNKENATIRLEPKRLYLPAVLITTGSNRLFERTSEGQDLVFNPNDIVMAEGIGEADVFRTTQLFPGVSATQENSGGLLIRGTNADQSMLQLDGFTIYHQDHFFGMLSAVNSHAVKTIRLQQNTMPSKYGGRIGGVVETIGKEGNLQKGRTQINLGMLAGSLSIEGPLDTAGKIGFIFNGRRSFTDGWYSPAYKELFSTAYESALPTYDKSLNQLDGDNAPVYYFQDANMKFTWRPRLNHKFNLSYYTSRDQLFIHYADTLSSPNRIYPKINYTDESRWKNQGVSAQYMHQKNGSHFFVRASLSDYDATYFSVDSVKALNEAMEIQIQNTLTNLRNIRLQTEKLWAKTYHTVTAGVEAEQVISQRTFAYPVSTGNTDKNLARWYHSYIQDDWSRSLRWSANIGLRMTWDQYTKQLLPEPRMVVAYKWPLRRLSMQLGYARMHQLIHRLRPQNLYQNNPDYWALSDNQSIPILRSDQFNFGVQKNFQHGQFQLDAFLRLQQGVTLFLGSLPGYDPSAAANDAALLIQGSGQNQGMEASYFFENKSHQVLISASFTKATSRFDQVDNQTIASSFVHLFEGKIYYEKQWKSWDYSCFWVMGSGLPYTPIGGSYTYTFPNGESTQMIGYGNYNSKRLSPYHRLDLSAHYLFDLKKTKLKIGASIYNVYNRTNIRSKIYFSYLNEDGDSQVYLVNQRMLGIVPSLQIELRF